VFPHLLFSSSTQEGRESFYGKSKLEGRILFEEWAKKNNATFTGLIIPNVYGPFSKPNYNTFVATFAQKLINREQPEIVADGDIKFIYVTNLCNLIIDIIKKTKHGTVSRIEISFDFIKKVSYILNLFTYFSDCYIRNGIIPELKGKDQINLFNTFRSYIDYSTHFPIKLNKKNDQRGFFVETIKLGIGGQVSFSTTLPGITRGNHFHTRKIERFTVIKGKARIQLRRIGSKELISHYLDGNEPAYVDMPIWYTHNITNIGKDELYTQFWINEWYDPEDGDTYYEEV
jgi:UDP-2-acetamido-2,6-beta-L-arabino-hexul-4-ose reductase